MDLLVTYDIADTDGEGARRLRRVHDLCSAYGHRVQLSVFECRLSPAGYAALRHELERLINPGKDCVNIYRFSGSIVESKTTLGTPTTHEAGDAWII
ncbi:MAG: CRISPR-associated endonuclease Cas2 [Acidimicrobiaceae bacterium]|nr:CRISPR-associated endonuclease Cas2 [Acidimicrobiaceae bacterium]